MKRLILFIVLVCSIGFSYGQGNPRSLDTDVMIIRDSMLLGGDWFVLTAPSDGQQLVRTSGVWVNTTVSSTPWDSLVWEAGSGDLCWYQGGVQVDCENLDDRYLLLSDTVDYIQWTDTASTIATKSDISDALTAQQTVFTVILPAGSTVADRIAVPLSVPSGWTLTADGVNLDIEHNLNRRVVAVTVFADAAASGFENQQLFNTAAYNGIVNKDSNNIKIQSLATINEIIYIELIFEN